MKRQNLRRSLSAFIVILAMSIPMISFAASYTTTFELAFSLVGPARSYSAGNLTVATYDIASTGTTSKLLVSVYKGNTCIDQKYYSSTAADSKKYTLPSAGKYKIHMDKEDDGVTVKGSMSMKQ